jgi:hypothetical protein
MKSITTIVYTLTLLLGVVTGCQDELAARYQNPNRDVTPTISEFFTAMLNNDRVRPSYWNMSTFINWHVGVYSQTVSYINSQSMYQQNEAYIQDRWDDFYRPGANGSGVMADYRELEKTYLNLSETQQADQALYFNAAKIVLYEQASQMVDLWGDIPFSQAGGLNATGEIIYPKFDSGEEVYQTMIDDLKSIAEYFHGSVWKPVILAKFAEQDILLFGDTNKWQRYCNSLRLRLLMRISFFNEAYAKEQVLEMLNHPAQYPLLNSTNYSPGIDDVLLYPLATYSDDLHQAFLDWLNYSAPYYALENVLKPANDLRIPVLYDKYGVTENASFIQNDTYNGLPLTMPMNDQKENLEHYAILDSVTFLMNSKLPGVVFTASEVNFLKSEAYQRWGDGDAAAEYFNGIKNSIKFYYYLNSLNFVLFSDHVVVPPTEAEIDSFLESAETLQFTGGSNEKLEKIWTQKWLHLGFMQAPESWAELRRTGYPALEFNPAPLTGYELPPNRLTYPANEKTYNENYAKVSSTDRRETRIFWHVR